MIINLKDAFLSDNYYKNYSFKIDLNENSDFSFVEKFLKPVEVIVDISSSNGVVNCDIKSKLYYVINCDRCLGLFDEYITIKTSRRIIRNNDMDDDFAIVVDNSFNVDLKQEALNDIILEFPTKHVCKDDCKGLCPKCGCNLNLTNCKCENKEIDPRLEALRKLC